MLYLGDNSEATCLKPSYRITMVTQMSCYRPYSCPDCHMLIHPITDTPSGPLVVLGVTYSTIALEPEGFYPPKPPEMIFSILSDTAS